MSIRREPSLHQQASFVFINNLRFLSMCAMFLEHSTFAVDSVSLGAPWLNTVLMTTSKFGTICFFLASGFLLGNSLERSRRLDYLQKRVRRILAPWAIWSLLFAILLVLLDVKHGRTPLAFSTISIKVATEWIDVVGRTPFWFVPNLMVSLCVLLLCRRWLNRLWLGGVFFSCSVFYGANIYLHLVPTRHTAAIFGFIFYLWLGFYCSQHLSHVRMLLDRIPLTALVGTMLLFWLCQLSEFQLIHRLFPKDDQGNTLRLTSQAFSLLVAAVIFRQSRVLSPGFVRVRQDTFSLYLLQTPMLFLWQGRLDHFTPHMMRPLLQRTGPHVALLAIFTLGVYLVSLYFGRLLASSRYLAWAVGSETRSIENANRARKTLFQAIAHTSA